MKKLTILSTALFVLLILINIPAQAVYPTYPDWSSSDDDFTMSIAVGDMDNDGDMDLVAGNYYYPYPTENITTTNVDDLDKNLMGGYIVIYENTGSSVSTSPDTIYSTRVGCNKIVLADFNHDDKLDIVVGAVVLKGNDGQDFILQNSTSSAGNWSFSKSSWWNPLSQDTYDLAVGDIDGDCELDIVAGGVNSDLKIWINEASTYTNPDIDVTAITPISFSTLKYKNLVVGLAVELADMDEDNDLDLILNAAGIPTIFWNSGSSPYFSDQSCLAADFDDYDDGRDDASCFSAGKVFYNNAWHKAIAAGNFSHKPANGTRYHEPRGINIYAYLATAGGIFKEIFRETVTDNVSYNLVTDIVWGDINDDTYPDIISGGYPTLDSDGDDWYLGYVQYELLGSTSTFTSSNMDWSSGNSDLTTSLAVGEFGDDDILQYSDVFQTSSVYFQEFSQSNVVKIVSVKDNDDTTNVVHDSLWCVDLLHGYISFDPDPDEVPEEVKVQYYYLDPDEIDLAVGNDGYNRIYYNGSSSNTNPGNPSATAYTVPSDSRTPGSAPTVSQMDSTAIGCVVQDINLENLQEDVLVHIPDIGIMNYWFWWQNTEFIRGLYFWNELDKCIDEIVDAEGKELMLLADGAGKVEWLHPPTTDDDYMLPMEELYSAYFARNLVNRYRPGGVLNGEIWGSDDGVEIYAFEGEPNGEWGTIAYKTDILSLVEKLKYNYGVIKSIDSDFTIVSPNFANDQVTIGSSSNCSFIDLEYIDTLYTATLDNALKKYTDVINQQFYTFIDGNHATDPATNELVELMLDTLDYLVTDHDDDDKLFMTTEWAFVPITGAEENPPTTDEQVNWTSTQIAEMFANKRCRWNFVGNEDPDILFAVNQFARILNGHRFEEKNTYYDIDVSAGPDDTLTTIQDYAFEFSGSSAWTNIHHIRTDSLIIENTVKVNLFSSNDSVSDGDNLFIENLNFSEYQRPAYEDGNEDSVWVSFLESELDETSTYIIEDFSDADTTLLTLNFPLREWIYVSLNVNPADPQNDVEDIFTTSAVPAESLAVAHVAQYQGNRIDGSWTWDIQSFNWDIYRGYKIWTDSITAITIGDTGWVEPDMEIDIAPYTDVDKYYYYIAYPPYWDMPCSTAFEELLDWYGETVLVWAANSDGTIYLPEEGGEIYNMRQGEGYYLRLTADSTLNNFQFTDQGSMSLESVTGKPGGEQNSIESIVNYHFEFRKRTQDLYPIVLHDIEIQGITIADDDEVGVFLWDSLCVGAKKLEGSSDCILTAWKDEVMTPDAVDGFIEGEVMTFKFWDASEDIEYDLDISNSLSSIQMSPSARYTNSPIFGQKDYAVLSFEGVQAVADAPESYALHQNYPNPFNPTTTIRFDLPEMSKVRLSIYNILGQEVVRLIDDNISAGFKSVKWDCASASSEIASGIYLYRLEAEGLNSGNKFAEVNKMVLIK